MGLLNSLQRLFTKGNYAMKASRSVCNKAFESQTSPVLNMQRDLLEVMRLEKSLQRTATFILSFETPTVIALLYICNKFIQSMAKFK